MCALGLNTALEKLRVFGSAVEVATTGAKVTEAILAAEPLTGLVTLTT